MYNYFVQTVNVFQSNDRRKNMEFKAGDIVKIKCIDNIKSDEGVNIQVGDTAKVVAVSYSSYSVLVEGVKWGCSLWFDYKDLEFVSNGSRVLEPVEVFKAILGGKELEFYSDVDNRWKPVEYPKYLSVGCIENMKFRLAKPIKDKRKEVISNLLEDNVAVLCKCWDYDECLATIQAVTKVDETEYPYTTDNDNYKCAYPIDNEGNEVVIV